MCFLNGLGWYDMQSNSNDQTPPREDKIMQQLTSESSFANTLVNTNLIIGTNYHHLVDSWQELVYSLDINDALNDHLILLIIW